MGVSLCSWETLALLITGVIPPGPSHSELTDLTLLVQTEVIALPSHFITLYLYLYFIFSLHNFIFDYITTQLE